MTNFNDGDYTIELTLADVLQALQLTESSLFKMVEVGIVEPKGTAPKEWSFDINAVCVARQATRIHRDLRIEWSAVAVIIDLVTERDQLHTENQTLKQQLTRFLHE